MAFLDFSEDQYVKYVDTGERIRMGGFQVAEAIELQYIRTTLIIEEALPTNEELVIEIHGEQTGNSKIFESDPISLSAIDDASTLAAGKTFIGWVRADFGRQNLNPNITYYAIARFDNYTRVVGGFSLALAYDFPFPIYDNGQSIFYNHSIAMQIFGWSARS